MFANSWSLALLVCSAAALFLAAGAVRTGIRVLAYWDADADTPKQIGLEAETWLSALLMEYGMLLQIISLLLLVLAADSYSEILVGAMCATGAFLANGFGVPLLLVKLFGLFFYGFWIVLHRLDISSEYSPLIRYKYFFLLMLLPLLALDAYLLIMYLARLEPDIITSCCGVVFGSGTGDGRNLVGPMPVRMLLMAFYGLAGLLFVFGFSLLKASQKDPGRTARIISILYSFLWVLFFLLSLLAITAVFSSYIYGMPSHRCPFDILKQEYNYIGYPIYIALIVAAFSGISAGGTILFSQLPGLAGPLRTFRKKGLQLALLLLALFLLLVTWFPVAYILGGGER
jgi:hypothetical protein